MKTNLGSLERHALTVLAIAGPRHAYGVSALLTRAGITRSRQGAQPTLARLERVGYVASETQPPAQPGRPGRRVFRITETGEAALQENMDAEEALLALLEAEEWRTR